MLFANDEQLNMEFINTLPMAIELERLELWGAAIFSFRTRRSSNSFCAKSDRFAMLCLQTCSAATLFQLSLQYHPATNW